MANLNNELTPDKNFIADIEWLNNNVDASKLKHHQVAQVVSVQKESYRLSKNGIEVFAELTGKLLYGANSAQDLPTTGDWVYVDFIDNDSHAIIHEVVPRKTLLQRKSSGKNITYQLIAANIDVAFIVQSADYNFNLRRLERYLVMIQDSHILPIILLSKADLANSLEITKLTQSIQDIAPNITVIAYSSLTGDHLDEIKTHLLSGQSYCLLGSSGVGKTSLLNSIVGSERFETQVVSKKDSKGKHTTTSRELVTLNNGAYLIDTPGMRELGNIGVESGLDEAFAEISALSLHCKFSNCSHNHEKGCAIWLAIDNNELAENRFNSYLKMKKESDFNEMSFLEKKKKDKNTGKLIKSIIKSRSKK